ncbi:helix-turn-helix transcriptional regulator [Desulfosporosinus sp. PR]|uniref:helix-turn-helix domain-containing protein n=1 Tax=Candidatus Desulfosporosinus nitrosoreducens TaxID=3401928 RepID=UPI0027FC658A|nr:helix-turn-helix transcriptional regulator [Desulfosporosinus sp. PR]MDQ7094170.1 helix-turn-helix transcriptional regulator [Desulfosporosinus sp. PR]
MADSICIRLKKARAQKNLTQMQVMKRTNINHKTLSGYENGVSEPDLETLAILAELYETTTDYLLGRSDDPKVSYLNTLPPGRLEFLKEAHPPYNATLSPKEERDLAKDLNKILSDLESNEALAFDGEPLDEETKELMKLSLEHSMRMAKQLAKKKFTPNKHK